MDAAGEIREEEVAVVARRQTRARVEGHAARATRDEAHRRDDEGGRPLPDLLRHPRGVLRDHERLVLLDLVLRPGVGRVLEPGAPAGVAALDDVDPAGLVA